MSETSERVETIIQQVNSLLERGDEETLRPYLSGLHPSDLADLIESLDEPLRVTVVSYLPAEIAADAIAEMEDVERPADLLTRLEPQQMAEIVEDMADDDAADILGELDPEEQARVLAGVAEEDAAEIERLLHYPEDTAGGIMTRELLAISSGLTSGDAIREIRKQAQEVDDFYTIFVVDTDRHLRGVVALHDLVVADPAAPLSDIIEQPPAVVPVDMDQEEVGRLLSRYNLTSIAVVDALSRLVGRVTFDDVIDVMEAETTEDILRFAAVSEEEELRGSTLDAIRSRIPWLLMSLITASVAASVVFVFQDTIEQIVVLAVVMPVIAGVGGNAGTQALAVTIRRIALSEESVKTRWGVVMKELFVGVANGAIVGAVAAVAGFLLPGVEPVFGLVVLLAMWGSLIVASFAGAFIPILLESLGLDPAVAASVFVTTLTDLVGFFLLLGLAAAVLL
jgi:magnesium transporter